MDEKPKPTAGRPRIRGWIAASVAVAVVVVAVFLVAQGGGSSGPLDAIAKAAEVTQREPGGRALINATVTSLTGEEGITESGPMTFEDNGRASGEITIHSPQTGKEVTVDSIAVGTTSYTSSADLESSLPEGKKWMKVDLAAGGSGTGSSDPVAAGPVEGLKILERVEGSEEVGKEDIRGVPTTHYRGTLPSADEAFGVKVDVAKDQIDVWIDAQDRVRRMELDVASSVGEVKTRIQMTIDFVEFGKVPKIELPPADEVFDGTSEIESQVQQAAEGTPEVQTIH
jgi:hypothetical protein